jgi:hypothetical protein
MELRENGEKSLLDRILLSVCHEREKDGDRSVKESTFQETFLFKKSRNVGTGGKQTK